MRLVGATFGAGLCMKHLALCTIGRFMERFGAVSYMLVLLAT